MISVRRTTYRGQAGFLVCGRRPGETGGWPVSIFTLTESSARHIAAKVKRGEQIDGADFDPQPATERTSPHSATEHA